jgi:hypothetical protein
VAALAFSETNITTYIYIYKTCLYVHDIHILYDEKCSSNEHGTLAITITITICNYNKIYMYMRNVILYSVLYANRGKRLKNADSFCIQYMYTVFSGGLCRILYIS